MKKKMWKKSLLSLGIALALSGTAWAMPSGGTVEMGNVAGGLPGGVIPSGTTINVITPSVIHWDSFGIESSEALNFNGAALLNRVTGGDPSMILGTLNINNSAWALINPNGIVVGPGAVINASHLLLSTLNVRNQDFMSHYGGGGSNENHWEFTTPEGRTIPAEVKLQGANVTVGRGGIEVYGGTVQLLDGVHITRSSLPTDLYAGHFRFYAVNHYMKSVRPSPGASGGSDEDVLIKATKDNLLRMDHATITSNTNHKSRMGFMGGRIEGKDSIIKLTFAPGVYDPSDEESTSMSFDAFQLEQWNTGTRIGKYVKDGSTITLDKVKTVAGGNLEFTSGGTLLKHCPVDVGGDTHFLIGGTTGVKGYFMTETASSANGFRMEGGRMNVDGSMTVFAGKVDFSGQAKLSVKKRLGMISANFFQFPDTNAAAGGNYLFPMEYMTARQENAIHLGDTEIKRGGAESYAFLAAGNVALESSTMDDKAPVTVAVGEKITPPGPTSPADTAPVRENLYTIDKGTSNFPAHTVYLEPTVQTTPPLVGPTTVTTPDSDNAQINTGWAAMNQVLQEDAAPEKAAALVKEFNEATKGERVQDAVDTFVGYVRAIETCGLSAEEKVALHRAVFDTYQPTAEEGAAAKAATQSEIDKKDPAMTEILTAQESFAPTEGTPIDLREPVTGL